MSGRFSIAMRHPGATLIVLIVGLTACRGGEPAQGQTVSCSDAVYREFELDVPTGDGRGHGPDLGSEEWKSVIEFKLGIRDQPGVPDRASDAWCRHIDEILKGRATSTRERAQ